MLFNSFVYLLAFLPVVASVYFLLAPRSGLLAKLWLVSASLFFYGWWDVSYVPLIMASCGFNYLCGRWLRLFDGARARLLLLAGVLVNLGLLGFFKYADFIAGTLSFVMGREHRELAIVLPLAISFFTFQQIAYLADCAGKKARNYNFFDYLLFVTFFPQLIAGPIVHHNEMMPQFEDRSAVRIDARHLALGLLLFAAGFFKKVVFADSYALWSAPGFAIDAAAPALLEAWAISLSYTLQLYFDFSGYTDMALGAALLFNIRLPFNFNSPYKAASIQDFWRRWHMTLGRFLRDYLYIPMGGNRNGSGRGLANLFVTFLAGGLWHGAVWTFVLWGALHGAAMVAHRLWTQAGLVMPRLPAVIVTFLFVNAAWVLFRAESTDVALRIYRGMTDFSDPGAINPLWLAALLAGLAIVFFAPASNRIVQGDVALANKNAGLLAGGMMALGVIVMEIRRTSEFLYFQF